MSSELRLKTQEAVDALVASVDNCTLALLSDTGTGLILCTSSGNTRPQNTLDRLANEALADLDQPVIGALAAVDTPRTVSVARIGDDGWVVAMRATACADEILVCQCETQPDRAALDGAAASVFDILSAAEGEQA